MASKEPLLKNKTVDEKLEEAGLKEVAPIESAPPYPVEKTTLEKQQAMKKFGLVSPKKGLRIDINRELHDRLKIAVIKMDTTQEEWLEKVVEKAVLEAEKKLEKII